MQHRAAGQHIEGHTEQSEQMEDADLLAAGLREEERVGTGIDRPLESTSMSLFERGTAFAEEHRHNNVDA